MNFCKLGRFCFFVLILSLALTTIFASNLDFILFGTWAKTKAVLVSPSIFNTGYKINMECAYRNITQVIVACYNGMISQTLDSGDLDDYLKLFGNILKGVVGPTSVQNLMIQKYPGMDFNEDTLIEVPFGTTNTKSMLCGSGLVSGRICYFDESSNMAFYFFMPTDIVEMPTYNYKGLSLSFGNKGVYTMESTRRMTTPIWKNGDCLRVCNDYIINNERPLEDTYGRTCNVQITNCQIGAPVNVMDGTCIDTLYKEGLVLFRSTGGMYSVDPTLDLENRDYYTVEKFCCVYIGKRGLNGTVPFITPVTTSTTTTSTTLQQTFSNTNSTPSSFLTTIGTTKATTNPTTTRLTTSQITAGNTTLDAKNEELNSAFNGLLELLEELNPEERKMIRDKIDIISPDNRLSTTGLIVGCVALGLTLFQAFYFTCQMIRIQKELTPKPIF